MNLTNPIEKRQRRIKLEKRTRIAKKAIAVVTLMMCIMTMAAMTVFAAGTVSTTDFINKATTVLQAVISLIGAGLAVWGVVNLIEGYGGDNAAAKSQGMKQLMAGIGLIVLAVVMVPVLKTMMDNATK